MRMKGLLVSSLALLLPVVATAQQAPPPQAPPAPPATNLKVGDKAPDFTLPSQLGKPVKLSDYKGKNVVLAFYVLAFTGG